MLEIIFNNLITFQIIDVKYIFSALVTSKTPGHAGILLVLQSLLNIRSPNCVQLLPR